MKTVRSEMLVKANVDENNNKFWKIDIYEDASIQVINGRVGSRGQLQPLKQFPSMAEADKFFDKMVRSKLKGEYRKFSGIASSEPVNNRVALETAARQQIRTRDSDVVVELIQRLVKANVHSILKSSDLKYDEDSGLFKTPLGIVTMDSIGKARGLLDQLTLYVTRNDFTSTAVKQALAEYLMLIPQKVGRKLDVESVIPDMDAVSKQNSLLDDLETSVVQAEQMARHSVENAKIEQLFSCEINVVSDKTILDEIENLYRQNANRTHASFGYSIKRVFEVKIDAMDKAFEDKSPAIGGIRRLWHGSRPGNILSILKSGLVIPRSTDPHVCGRMFGDGLYFSDQSTKSLNYATGWWAGAKESQCFMLLADVAMGRTYVPNSHREDFPRQGFDSTFAIGGQSGVQNNEMIVYDTAQASIRYLVEFQR